MSASPKTGLLGLGTFLVGLALGGLAVTLLSSGRGDAADGARAVTAAPAGRPVVERDPELTQVLARLDETLALLAATLAAPTPAASERAPVGSESPYRSGDDALAAALRDLAESLRRLPSTHPYEEPVAPRAFTTLDERLQAFAPVRIPPASYHDEKVHEQAQRDLRATHILLSTDTLIERYGRPREIWVHDQGTEGWNYELELGDGHKEGYTFYVWNGKVISAESYYDIEEDG